MTVAGGSGAMAGSRRNWGGVDGSAPRAGTDPELHDLAGGVGIGDLEVVAGITAAERLVRARRCRARGCPPARW